MLSQIERILSSDVSKSSKQNSRVSTGRKAEHSLKIDAKSLDKRELCEIEYEATSDLRCTVAGFVVDSKVQKCFKNSSADLLSASLV